MTRSRLGLDMVWTTIASLTAPATGLLVAPVLARGLSPDGRGDLAAATAPLMLFGAVFTFGLPEAVMHFSAKHPTRSAKIIRMALPRTIMAGFLGLLASAVYALVVADGRTDLTIVTVVASLAVPLTLILGLIRGGAAGTHNWAIVNREKYISAAVRLVGVYGLFFMNQLTLATATVVMAFGPLTGSLAYLAKKKTVLRTAYEPETVRGPNRNEILIYGRKVWFGSLSGYVLGRVDQFLMPRLTSPTELGYYAAGVNVSDGVSALNVAVRDVTFASQSAGETGEKAAAAARISLLVSAVFSVPAAAMSSWWFPLLFGSEYEPGVTTANLLILAAMAGVPGAIAGVVLIGRGAPELRSRVLMVAAVVNVLLVLALTPSMGAVGAAWASVVGAAVAGNGNIYYLVRRFGFKVRDFYAIRTSDFMRLLDIGKTLLKPKA